jgi:hypothetical protein
MILIIIKYQNMHKLKIRQNKKKLEEIKLEYYYYLQLAIPI